jgi:hypothetical protein
LTETVQLIERRCGTVFGCAVAFAAQSRDSYQILARPDAEGVWLWCRYCHGRQTSGCRGCEHCVPWAQMLTVMERFLTPGEFMRVLAAAIRRPEDREE